MFPDFESNHRFLDVVRIKQRVILYAHCADYTQKDFDLILFALKDFSHSLLWLPWSGNLSAFTVQRVCDLLVSGQVHYHRRFQVLYVAHRLYFSLTSTLVDLFSHSRELLD